MYARCEDGAVVAWVDSVHTWLTNHRYRRQRVQRKPAHMLREKHAIDCCDCDGCHAHPPSRASGTAAADSPSGPPRSLHGNRRWLADWRAAGGRARSCALHRRNIAPSCATGLSRLQSSRRCVSCAPRQAGKAPSARQQLTYIRCRQQSEAAPEVWCDGGCGLAAPPNAQTAPGPWSHFLPVQCTCLAGGAIDPSCAAAASLGCRPTSGSSTRTRRRTQALPRNRSGSGVTERPVAGRSNHRPRACGAVDAG